MDILCVVVFWFGSHLVLWYVNVCVPEGEQARVVWGRHCFKHTYSATICPCFVLVAVTHST